MTLNKNKLLTGIKKSGFVLENRVSALLKQNGWSVIQNRYYIDDVNGTEREIDMIAYNVLTDPIENISYYTALIISCKKNEKNYWVFLTSEDTEDDPNMEYFPIHYATKDVRLSHMIIEAENEIIRKLKAKLTLNSFTSCCRRINAFQLVNKESYNADKDTNGSIYISISTIIKSLEAEKKNIHTKADKRFYSFYLYNIFDGEMIDIDLGNDSVNQINNINYFNRHIINRVDNHYRIRFITEEYLNNNITELNHLFITDKEIYPQLITDFYINIFEHRDRVKLYWGDFERAMLNYLNYIIEKKVHGVDDKLKELGYTWNTTTSQLEIEFGTQNYENVSKIITVFNSDEDLEKYTAKRLKDIFRYEGKFIFSDDLPF